MPTDLTAPAEGVLDRNVACEVCGYNLRGLTPAGRCPECAHAIESSLLADERRRERQRPPSPWFAREVIEGAALGLCALLLVCSPLLAPDAWTRRHTTGRAVLMSLLATAWVLTLASTWKLSGTDPQAGRGSRGLTLPARGVAIAWLSGAFWFGFEAMGLPEHGPPLDSLPLYGSGLCGVVLAGLLPLRVGQLLYHVRCPLAMSVAFLLVALAPVVSFVLVVLHRGFGPSSFEFLMQAPLPPFGSGEIWRYLPRILSPGGQEWPVLMIPAVGVAYAVLLVRLISTYLPLSRTRAAAAAPPG